MTPREELLHHLAIERLTRPDEDAPPLSPETWAERRGRLQATLEQAGLEDPEPPRASPSGGALSFQLRTDPIASLAAADVVKLAQRFALGTLRLLHSPLRADLAAEVLLDDDRLDEHGGWVFFVRGPGQSVPVAVIPNASPVFCGLFAEDFITEALVQLDALPADRLGPEHFDALRRSRRSLRDPADRAWYDALLGGRDD